MKKKVFFAFFALICALAAEAKIGTQIGNVMARKTTSLNGQWNYIVDVQEEYGLSARSIGTRRQGAAHCSTLEQ